MKHDLNKVIEPGAESQNAAVLDHLTKHGSITALEAVQKLNCWRLAARVYDLRKYGWNINTMMVGVRNKYARYFLKR